MTPPCGVPERGKKRCAPSITPALSHLSIVRRSTPSRTRRFGTVGRSDSLPSFPLHFVSFVPRYRRDALASLQRTAGIGVRWPGLFSRSPPTGLFSTETTGPPRFPDEPQCVHATVLRPRRSRAAKPERLHDAAFRCLNGVGLLDVVFSGLDRSGLPARCLRFAAPVTRNHARLASGWWPTSTARASHPLGPSERFLLCIATSLPPYPGFAWRTASSSPTLRTPDASGRGARPPAPSRR